jgi:two-component system sensor histidine kinase AgrC
MIWNIAECIAIFAECFMITRLLVKYFGFKLKEQCILKCSILFSWLSAIGILGTFIIKQEWFFILGFIVSEIVFSLLLLKGNVFERCLLCIISYVLFYFINLPVLNFIGLLSGADVAEIVSAQDARRIACLFTSKMLYFAATEVILWIRKKELYHFKINEWIIIVSAFFITLMIGFLLYMITERSELSNFVFMAIALLLSTLDVIVLVFMRKLNLVNQKETKRQLLNLQLTQQQNEIRQLDQQYQKLSTLQHDFTNKIDCIHGLMLQGEYTKAITYSETLLGQEGGSIYTFIQCSSSVINAVVNSKFGKAHEYGIKTSCRIVVPIPEYLEFDLSILLSNLLDNAIEACQKNNISSQIILTISEFAGYYRVTVKNTIEHSVLKENRKLETFKANKQKHGWGLKSIQDIADVHQGGVDIYEKSGMFVVNILMMKDE